MGSDRMSKERRSKKRSSYSSGSEDEGKNKRQRREEDGERKSRKRDNKEKRTDKKSRKDSKRHSDKEKKSKDKHKRKHHKSDRHLNEVQELSNDDYFSKNNEFATWLKEKKNVFFSDLSSESAHELFSDFVKAWNDQKLESRYYEGIASAPRTSHNWKIKN